MAGEKADRRVQKTRALLHEALLDLMIEKGYEAITVQDLIDRANVGRSTFYSHFEDKESLLASSLEQLRGFLLEQYGQADPLPNGGAFRFRMSLSMMQHVQSHKRLYRSMIGKPGGALVAQQMQRMLTLLMDEELDGIYTEGTLTGVPREIAASFVVSTFFTVLTWWMSQAKPCSAEEADRIFHQLVLSGVSTVRPQEI